MLNIIVDSFSNEIENEITNPGGYFDATYEQSWFQSDLARKIIKGIDDTEYISGEYFESPVFGGIPPRDLSTGCKATLLLLNEDGIVVRGERFGDNCAIWLLKIADIKDITISLNHVLKFPENVEFKVHFNNTGKIVTNYKDYINELVHISNSIME